MIAFIACCFCTFSLLAQVKMPQPSTTQTIKQDFGMGNIELTYSRPNIKGRKVFGDLVPYGKLWRTGANGATKLFFNDAVEIGGKTEVTLNINSNMPQNLISQVTDSSQLKQEIMNTVNTYFSKTFSDNLSNALITQKRG